jgi:hypothetical protein
MAGAGQPDTINRDYSSHALFDVGRCLSPAAAADARVVDFNGATPQISTTAPMAWTPSAQLGVLADGTVIATGAISGASLVDLNAGVYPAEQWNRHRPVADTGGDADHAPYTRQLAARRACPPAAGSAARDQVYLGKNAEIFSRPLFQADGTLAPRAIDRAIIHELRPSIEIATANPASIRKVALVRLARHALNNMEQRHPALLHRRRDKLTALTPNANATARLYALHPRRQRRAFRCPHGQRPRQLAASVTLTQPTTARPSSCPPPSTSRRPHPTPTAR